MRARLPRIMGYMRHTTIPDIQSSWCHGVEPTLAALRALLDTTEIEVVSVTHEFTVPTGLGRLVMKIEHERVRTVFGDIGRHLGLWDANRAMEQAVDLLKRAGVVLAPEMIRIVVATRLDLDVELVEIQAAPEVAYTTYTWAVVTPRGRIEATLLHECQAWWVPGSKDAVPFPTTWVAMQLGAEGAR